MLALPAALQLHCDVLLPTHNAHPRMVVARIHALACTFNRLLRMQLLVHVVAAAHQHAPGSLQLLLLLLLAEERVEV
jgi:hypothetical protein